MFAWAWTKRSETRHDQCRTLLCVVFQKLENLERQGEKLMALGQDILDAVTAETTIVDSYLALVQGLINDNTIPADVGVKILAAINDEKAKVAAAITANTPVPPVIETKTDETTVV
jgi:hypothetical protein